MTLDPVLTSAFVFLVLALVIFFFTTTKAGAPHQNRTLIVSWLLFALFASLLLFRFFPGNEASGTIFGLSVTGAVAVFLVVWGLGPMWSTKADELDALRNKNQQLEADIKVLREAPGKRAPAKLPPGRIPFTLTHKKGRTITIATGNLSSVKKVDIWVNSENTYMLMARFFERNISGTIRYLGAKRDKGDFVVDDVIGKAMLNEMGHSTMVSPGAIIETTSGELLGSHGVQRVLHVAAVIAQYEAEPRQIENLSGFVSKVFERGSKPKGCRSILFPLLGTGTARGDVNSTAEAIVSASISWLESVGDDGITDVHLLAWSDVECNAWKQALEKSGKVQPA